MTMPDATKPDATKPANFIQEIIEEDLRTNGNQAGGKVITRFPPEPNAFLHIGHAKAICLDFGTALKYGGYCNLRMDDTNPIKEKQEFVDAIKADVRWLGFEFEGHETHAADCFDQLYEWAVALIKAGKAYVCDLTPDEVSRTRGSLTKPGTDSPFRTRSAAENLDLFARMKAGEFPDGARTLRAKIDMAAANVNLRDPIMYRILHAEHQRTGDKWCIYPTYDWAHGQCDWIEGVTHSLCDQAYEIHRPLYDWFLDQLIALGLSPKGVTYRPKQREFARLNLPYTVLSKRRFLDWVEGGHVTGLDDPRMPTLSGMRRRGYPPEAIRAFCDRIGVAKRENVVEFALLEYFVREELNKKAARRMAVVKPLKLVIENYPEGQSEELDAVNNPEDETAGSRKVPFGKVLYVEQDDFMEVPAPKYFRLYPGNEVRLRYGYLVRCTGLSKDAAGNVTEIRCTYEPATRGGNAPDGRKVKATIHWVSAAHALDAEVRLYDHLFTAADPDEAAEGKDWRSNLNPNSLEVVRAKVEPSLAGAKAGDVVQFERLAYFCVDRDSTPGRPVFNRTVSLKDTWAKMANKG
ncbi:MAG: glutamine--tRNA ligase/YqeY domain fusion protein [Planctomycetota bacterium]|nr:glutamine--tRNA ligase/YqeY domain fusion protein [Planctomycetota bacterium]